MQLKDVWSVQIWHESVSLHGHLVANVGITQIMKQIGFLGMLPHETVPTPCKNGCSPAFRCRGGSTTFSLLVSWLHKLPPGCGRNCKIQGESCQTRESWQVWYYIHACWHNTYDMSVHVKILLRVQEWFTPSLFLGKRSGPQDYLLCCRSSSYRTCTAWNSTSRSRGQLSKLWGSQNCMTPTLRIQNILGYCVTLTKHLADKILILWHRFSRHCGF